MKKGPYKNWYKVKIEHPILRRGMSIETEVDDRHIIDAVKTLKESAIAINKFDKKK